MNPIEPPVPMRLGVFFENTVGHVTFAQTIAGAVAQAPDIDAQFFPISVPARGLIDQLSLLEHNWSLHASLDTRMVFLRRRREFDALLFHTQTLSQLSVGVMRRIPSVISLDATPVNFDEVGAGYGHYPDSEGYESFKRQVLSRPLRAARRLVAWSEWVRGSLIGDYGVPSGRIDVIPAGTDLSRHRPRRGPRRSGPPRILFVGGAYERKGGPQLVAAVRRLPFTVQVDLVTHEPPADTDQLTIHTDLRPGDLRIDKLYADADLFVLPTRGDASPHVILEAMAAGLPVVTTTLGAIPEIVGSDTGLLVAPDDESGLAGALELLCSDLDRAREMGERGRERAAELFDASRNVGRILDVLRVVAAQPAAAAVSRT